jgi:hypothetical protein
MEEKRDERRRGGCTAVAVTVAVIALMLPFIYAASIGPVLWLDEHGYITVLIDLRDGFYDPLRFVCRQFQPFQNLLEWWVCQWIDVGHPSDYPASPA